MAEADTRIDPVASDAASGCDIDPSSQHLLDAERPYIDARRLTRDWQTAAPLTALALSGGGIRSAAFALGVMQKFAAADYLRLFDYLSTVSGGGFIGSSLTWFTSGLFKAKTSVDFGLDPTIKGGERQPFPYGSADPGMPVIGDPPGLPERLLAYLVSHGQYLIPGGGITLRSGIAVVLRGILLNLLVWFPISAALAALLAAVPVDWLWHGFWPVRQGGYFCVDLSSGNAAAGSTNDANHACLPPGFAGILLLAALLWLLFLLASAVYSFKTYRRRSEAAVRYADRRRFERNYGTLLLWAVAFTVVGSLPWVAGYIDHYIGEKGGFGFLIAGAASGVWSFFKSGSDKSGKIPLEILAPIAAVLFCYGFGILAFDAGLWSLGVIRGDGPETILSLLLFALVIFSILLGWLVNLNYLSLHRYYRDRLMEAFMPDLEKAETNTAGPAPLADTARLSEMCDPAYPVGPYHLINANLILTGTQDKLRRLRGGDSFLLSPRYSGSNATGWQPTKAFLGDEMTLPTAMAISGAAANPNAGSGGVGAMRNPVVSIVMSLFNVRLGYWIANPRQNSTSRNRPNHFNPGLADLVDSRRDETASLLRLSDGGHFDNLGLYELIRRRVEFIVVCDAGADPDCKFADLTNALARAQQDFGARIEFDDVPALAPMMPSINLDFPRAMHRALRGHARARITYANGSRGILLYVTTMIVDRLRLELLGYLGANPNFPDETTADQFFSTEQFNAYRELGYAVAGQMLDGPRGCRAEFDLRLKRLTQASMAP